MGWGKGFKFNFSLKGSEFLKISDLDEYIAAVEDEERKLVRNHFYYVCEICRILCRLKARKYVLLYISFMSLITTEMFSKFACITFIVSSFNNNVHLHNLDSYAIAW